MFHFLAVSVAVAAECTPRSAVPGRPSFLLAAEPVAFVAVALDEVAVMVVSFRPFFVPSVVDWEFARCYFLPLGGIGGGGGGM